MWNRNQFRTLLLLLAVLCAAGCSYLEPAADKVADGVRIYCGEPAQSRTIVRDAINAELRADGHSVRVTCAGDP